MYKILQGDCLETLKTLPNESVQCCVTSPPYYGLRDYGVDGQIGLEETPEIYVNKLVEVFREVRRVLKDDGVVFLNLGDSYAGSGKGGQSEEKRSENWQPTYANKGMTYGLKPKDLIGIPWMVAFALRADGWWLRQDIIWAKPNPMPESVTDRCTKSHEYIFLLTKSARYYYDAEAIKEPANYDGRKDELMHGAAKYNSAIVPGDQVQSMARDGHVRWNKNADGLRVRNKRSVWTVTTKPYKEAHFATFPPDLIEPCILAGTSEKGECPECGKAWVRVVEKEIGNSISCPKEQEAHEARGGTGEHKGTVGKSGGSRTDAKSTTIGWQPQCECVETNGFDPLYNMPYSPVPQTVLDPFNGSGTAGEVSIKHHRNYIGCELNPDYIELTHKRLAEVQPTLKGM